MTSEEDDMKSVNVVSVVNHKSESGSGSVTTSVSKVVEDNVVITSELVSGIMSSESFFHRNENKVRLHIEKSTTITLIRKLMFFSVPKVLLNFGFLGLILCR